ncbi:MAG: hypothetical protein QOI95_2929 [Acidimicrobiaceae bacterium]|jgi:hypothetical protein
MPSIAGRAVFFSELDDDFQNLAHMDGDSLLQRLTTYYLLAPSVIVHPAYFWQSDVTNALLNNAGRELLRPPFTQLELGMHGSIEDYMAQRIAQLRVPQYRTAEYRSYEARGGALFEEARNLSIRFNTAATRRVTVSRRDAKFRDLLAVDLAATRLDSTSLGTQLGAIQLTPDNTLVQSRLGETLTDFVTTADLVSVDTFILQLHTNGFGELANDPNIRRRLLALYYETYTDPDTINPGTNKFRAGTVLNPYDVDLFWDTMSRLFGVDSSILSRPRDAETLLALRDIRESSDWQTFTHTYFDLLGTMDDSLRETSPEVVIALKELNPGKTRNYVLRRLWEDRKGIIAGAVFSALAVPGFALDAGASIPMTASVAGSFGVVVSAKALLGEIRRFVERYHTQDLVKVRATVRAHVNRAVRAAHLRESDETA